MSLFHAGLQPALNADGATISGATWSFYLDGTLTPTPVYSNAALTISLGSSETADADGRFPVPMFINDAVPTRAILRDAAGITIEDIPSINAGSAFAPYSVATRTALKALSTPEYSTAFLLESGRQGLFVWTSGNFSAVAPVDTQEGVYIAPDSDPTGASGVWIRQVPIPNVWHADWFGIPADPASGQGGGTEVLAHTQLSAMISLVNLVGPEQIIFGSKIYTLGAALPQFTTQIQLIGARGTQMTIFVKRYVEADAVRGVFSFGEHAFVFRNISMRAKSGSGGSLISAVLPTNTTNQGIAILENYILSGESFVNHAVHFDGSANVVVPVGYRGIYFGPGEIFGAAVSSISLVGVQHVFSSGMFATTSGGTSSTVLTVTGNATFMADDVQLHGVVDGDVALTRVSRATFVSPKNGNLTLDANCTDVAWIGSHVSGGFTNNAAAGEFSSTANLDGTGAKPSWFFSNDPDTGFFRSGSDLLNVTTGGTNRAVFSSSGITVSGSIEASSQVFANGSSVLALRLRQTSGSFFMGATNAAAPDLVFSNNGGTEVGRLTTSGILSATGSLKSPSYTVATVPSAATHGAGAGIYVSNESGGAVTAFSDATNWRRVTDRAVVS